MQGADRERKPAQASLWMPCGRNYRVPPAQRVHPSNLPEEHTPQHHAEGTGCLLPHCLQQEKGEMPVHERHEIVYKLIIRLSNMF